nr:hypothetical protein [Chitinophagaceae bacterium]
MRICVISIIHEPWGGSEELWAAMAREALNRHMTVHHSRLAVGPLASKEQALLQVGLQPKDRRGFTGYIRQPWLRIAVKALHLLLDRVVPDYTYINAANFDAVLYVGTGLSAAADRRLLQSIINSGVPLFVNFQLCQESGRFSTTADWQFMRQLYQKAVHLFFVSHRNHVALQNMLAQPLPHASVVRNPVNMPSTDYIPFPATDGTARLAMLGNLLCMHKGQDAMLQVLGSETWQSEN